MIEIYSLGNDKTDWKDFLELPWKIYKDNEYWVPPLLSEIRKLFNVRKNPFWEHASQQIFLARKNGVPVGRIAAIIDDNHNNFHQEKTGFFGFFESINNFDVARLLFDEAKGWLKRNRMNVIRGPANPSLNDECAFLLEGFDKSPTLMMPYTQPYYLEFMERYGFRKAKDLYAFSKNISDGIPERIEKLAKVLTKRKRIKLRCFDKKHYNKEIGFLKDIYNSAWEKNWGFVPMTEKEMNLTAKQMKPFAEPELIIFAEVDDRPVAVMLSLPDINFVLRKLNGRMGPVEILKFLRYKRKINRIRLIMAGVKKEYRNKGIMAVLYCETEKNAVRLGYRHCEFGWTLEDNDNVNNSVRAIGGKIYKKYRIYEKEI